MYRVWLWSETGDVIDSGDESLIDKWKNSPGLYIWVDATENDPIRESQLLQTSFGLHRLAISDAQRQRHPPKIEVFGDNWLLLLKELSAIEEDIDFTTSQIAIFTGAKFIVTRRSGGSPAVDTLRSELKDILGGSQPEPARLAIRLARMIADAYVKMLLNVEDHLEDLEEQMFERPHDAILAVLIRYQTHLRKIIRILSYHKQNYHDADLSDLPHIHIDLEHEWNDAYEHSERGHSLASLYYENASDLIDGYISVASHRLNQIMKILTVITVIFVPLSFIAGIYGMNFENMPELKSKSGYFILLGTMASIATILLFIFRKKRWL